MSRQMFDELVIDGETLIISHVASLSISYFKGGLFFSAAIELFEDYVAGGEAGMSWLGKNSRHAGDDRPHLLSGFMHDLSLHRAGRYVSATDAVERRKAEYRSRFGRC